MEEDDEKFSLLKEHEKFLAFLILILAVCGLVLLASTFDRNVGATDLVMQAKLRIIDSAIAGLLTITGMAAQALFRISSVDKQNAVSFKHALEKMPTPTQEVKVVNPPEDPANVTDAHADEEDIPEYAK